MSFTIDYSFSLFEIEYENSGIRINLILDSTPGGGGGLTEAQVQTLIDNSISALIAGAPGALDTLNELAAALGDDANFAATVTTALNARMLKGSNEFTLAAPLTISGPGLVSSFGQPLTLPDASLWESQEITVIAAGGPGSDVVITAHTGQTINVSSPTFTLQQNQSGFPNVITLRSVALPVAFGGGWTWVTANHAGPQFVGEELTEIENLIAGLALVTDDHELRLDDIEDSGIQIDKRALSNEMLRQEWDAITHPLLATSQDIADAGSYDGTWAITRATARGTLPHTPAGLDIQCFHMIQRPWTQKELDDEGKALTEAFQTFYELITLPRPSIENDWFEWARVFLDSTFSGFNDPTVGTWGYFYENTIVTGTQEAPFNATTDGKNTFGWPERARMTLNCSTSTVTFWEWIPMDTGEAGVEQCQFGRWWRPWFTSTNAAWASMANPETETVPAVHAGGFNEGDPEVMVPWRIGIQSKVKFAEFYLFEYGETDPANALLAIDEAALTAAGVGSSSFVDSTGVNTIVSVAARTIAGPAAGATAYNPLVIKTPKYEGIATRDWSLPGIDVLSISSTTPSTNRPTFQPFVIDEDREYDAFMHEITAAGASGTLGRFAIYNVDENYNLTDRVYQSGTYPCDPGSVPGVQIVTASIVLPKGPYMAVSINNGSVQFRTILGVPHFPSPIIAGTTAGFRGYSTLTSRTYTGDGFPADATADDFNWDRDIGTSLPSTAYLFRLREAI